MNILVNWIFLLINYACERAGWCFQDVEEGEYWTNWPPRWLEAGVVRPESEAYGDCYRYVFIGLPRWEMRYAYNPDALVWQRATLCWRSLDGFALDWFEVE